MSRQLSDLAFIDVQDANPLILFKKWHNEIMEGKCLFFQTNTMCLATSPRNGKVSNRTVVVKRYDDDGFVFATAGGSRKTREIEENPCAAATIMWNYQKDGKEYLKQVRIEGEVNEISRKRCQEFYDSEDFYCKIRSHLCNSIEPVDWNVLKKKHDNLVDDVMNKRKELTMPDNYVGYQLVPERMEFYFTWNHCIADRVVFTKDESGWNYFHMST